MEKQKKKRIVLGSFIGLLNAAVIAGMVAVPLTLSLVVKTNGGGDEPISEHGFGLDDYSTRANAPVFSIYCEAHDEHILSNFVLKTKEGSKLAESSEEVQLDAGEDKRAEVSFEPFEVSETISDATLTFNVLGFEDAETIGGITIINPTPTTPGWRNFILDQEHRRMSSDDTTDVGTQYSYKAQNLFSLYHPEPAQTLRISFFITNQTGDLRYDDYDMLSCKIDGQTFELGNGIISYFGIPQIDYTFDSETIYNKMVEVEIKSKTEIQDAHFIMQYTIAP